MVPETGVHPKTPAPEYHAWEALSNSQLTLLKRSPAHLRYALDNPDEGDTPALKLGRAAHAAVLEPDVFTSVFVALREGLNLRTNDGKAERADLYDQYGPENVLTADEYQTCIAMRDAVWACDAAKLLLGSEGDCELSMAWDDPTTGIRCKGRLDRASWKVAGGTVIDYKTCRNASWDEFERSIYQYGYHRQGKHYLNACEVLGPTINHYVIIAQEKEPPYACAFYRLDEQALMSAQTELDKLIRLYAECVKRDDWPGYPDQIMDIGLPAWAVDKIDRESELVV